MKKYFTQLLLLVMAVSALPACREASRIPEPATESIPLVIPEINPQKSYFDYPSARNSVTTQTTTGTPRPVFEFVVNPSKGYSELQTVEVYKSFRRNNILGPRVKVMDLTSFPATVTIDSQEAIKDLFPNSPTTANPAPTPVLATSPGARNNMLNGEAVVFTFEYVMKDGRRIILTPLSTTTGSVGAPTGTLINAPYAAVAEFRI
ncbi:hypothetical protein MUN81_06840 [Hymenobacter sp. 5317J-9]|uniref:hypothetical protein n=1 Tax=Hymenobacter sp. 5317J-9 TaxID=2932250 RepID=UPI001FD70359|nr:hypothetical protein [Hymenobacter sp. 5317J-9]UOQ99205.1 hypothetical protein MUN81_06840 [Hymenobacter sp. 5317J-9]